MRETPSSLEDLRSEIDQIDDALQDLLIRRAAVTRSIAKVKHGNASPKTVRLSAALRPAREALILRRLLARRTGDLAPQLVVGIWREIIAASLRAQSDFRAHVYAEGDETAYVGMARTYFGSAIPIRTHSKPSLVVHACAEETNALGVVPLPQMEEPGASWWAQLAPAGEKGPRVIAKLPVIASDDAPAAYVIGAVEQEPTGDDTTLLLLEITSGMSRTRLQSMLKQSGLAARLAARGRISEMTVPDELLLEIKGFVGKDDQRLGLLKEIAGDAIARIALIGGYADPVVLSEIKAP